MSGCIDCGTALTVSFDYPPIPVRTSDYSCHCPSCYDGAPDSGEWSRLQGHGATAEGATADWFAKAYEILSPFVCPGCHAVGEEPCHPGCIDDEIRNERADRHFEEYAACERINAAQEPRPMDDDE